MEFIDTHAHLDISDFKGETEKLLRHARDSEVVNIINVGFDVKSSQNSINLASKYGHIYATVGMHPHDSRTWDKEKTDRIKTMATQEKVVAIGEIGLDYFRNLSSPDEQRKCFREQLEIAEELKCPVVIHCREAWSEVVRIIDGYNLKSIVLHSFSGDTLVANWAFDKGYHLSFNGGITYPRKTEIHNIIKTMPRELMLLETDCPYLTPVPLRGKRNEPAYIRHTAVKLSNILGVTLGYVAQITTQNAKNLFGIVNSDRYSKQQI